MSTFIIKKLSELCDVRDGTHDSPKQSTTGYPLVTSKHIKAGRLNLAETYLISEDDYKQINNRSKVDQGDLLLSMIGTVGEVVIVKEKPTFAIKNVGLIKPNDENLGYYLYYYLISAYGQNAITKVLSGSSQKFISLGRLRDLCIQIPDSGSVLKNIVDVIKTYDDLIENNERRIKILEEMAQRLYTEWFVKFKFPGHEKVKLVNSDTKFGKMPEGWEVKSIGDMLAKVKRKTKIPASEYLEDGEFPVVDQGNDFIAGFTNDETAIYEEELIVFGDHSRCFKFCNFKFACGADGTQLLLSNDLQKMPQKLFYLTVMNSGLQNFGYSRHFKFLKSLKVVVPDGVTAGKFSNLFNNAFDQVRQLQQQNATLAKMRDLLIPQLVSGKREIK